MAKTPYKDRHINTWKPANTLAEGRRLFHDLPDWEDIGRMVGKKYKVMRARRSVCRRPGCTAELLLLSNFHSDGSDHQLLRASAVYAYCTGDGAPDSTGLDTGRKHTDETKTTLGPAALSRLITQGRDPVRIEQARQGSIRYHRIKKARLMDPGSVDPEPPKGGDKQP